MIAVKGNTTPINEGKIIENIRALGIDMIDEAKSGHPGIVLGAAPILYTLYAHHLRIDPKNPTYFNRDRFVMSAGHGSALLYATLAMAGFDLELEDLKAFRKLGSKTPGHPEFLVTPGVEMSTGPLGQGVATSVGMAIASKYQQAVFNKEKKNFIDYRVYCLVGDGDLMEGVSYEALSLAGTLKLDNLILLYDSNQISLDGKTEMTFKENIKERFEAMGFEVFEVLNGEDITAIDKAIESAKVSSKPSLIEIHTTIGKFSKLENTNKVHGTPLDREDITSLKEKLHVRDIPFTVSQEALEDFQYQITNRCGMLVEDWNKKRSKLSKELEQELLFLEGSDKSLKMTQIDYLPPANGKESLRETSSKILTSLGQKYTFILNGSADLFSSCKNYIDKEGDFSAKNPLGKNIWFGVREHAQAAIANGLALCGMRPVVSTYLAFSDYLRPALRMTALMNLPVVYLFTHDSISVGQDGPTHQAVEQLVSLRAMPNLDVYRPADANEIIGSYTAIFESNHPACLILGRNSVPVLEGTSASKTQSGAYIVKQEERKLDGIVISTGEELLTAQAVVANLFQKGYDLRLISIPCLEKYELLPKEEKEKLFPVGVKKFVIEKSSSYSWYQFVYDQKYLFTQDCFGASGSLTELDEAYGFKVSQLEEKIEKLLH